MHACRYLAGLHYIYRRQVDDNELFRCHRKVYWGANFVAFLWISPGFLLSPSSSAQPPSAQWWLGNLFWFGLARSVAYHFFRQYRGLKT